MGFFNKTLLHSYFSITLTFLMLTKMSLAPDICLKYYLSSLAIVGKAFDPSHSALPVKRNLKKIKSEGK
jgi:hypothetical protein